MAFPKDSLHSNESLVFDLKPHWWRLVPPSSAASIAVAVSLAATLADWPQFARNVLAAVVAVTGLWALSVYIRWTTTHFVLTSDRVITRSGVLAKRGVEIPLERINTILFDQGPFERLVGVGDLVIESAAKEGGQRFEDVRRPDRIQNAIYIQCEANESRQADRISSAINTNMQQAPTVSIPDQIAQLASLCADGIITQEEFDAKKAQLLDRM